MQSFSQLVEANKPSKKKPLFTINDGLRSYLKQHGRDVQLPVSYYDLLQFTYSVPIRDRNGKDTLWESASYDLREWDYLRQGLVHIYAILKTEGDLSFIGQ